MYVFSIALRHLRSRPMSWVAAAIMVLIVVIYLLVISVMEGFKTHYMEKLRSVRSHITVQVGNIPWGIIHPESWSKEFEAFSEIKGATYATETPTIAVFDHARTVGTLRGVHLSKELACGELGSRLEPKDLKAFGRHQLGVRKVPGCIVGDAWRKNFDLKKGGHVTFMFTNEDEDPRVMQFYVIGFFKVGNDYLEHAAYVDQKLLAEEMGTSGTAKTISLWVKGDPDRPDLDQIRHRIEARMKAIMDHDTFVMGQNAAMPADKTLQDRVQVQTWRESEKNLYHAITQENKIMRFIMGIFLLFATIIIFLIFGRQVSEKIRDIGVLRAMGATPSGIIACFLLQGLTISLIGVVLGLTVGWQMIEHINEIQVCANDWFGIQVFPGESFLIDHIPTKLLLFDVVLISGLAIFSGFMGALLPAVHASRINPVECLRHE